MAYITEFLQHQIKQHMEDPEERQRRWEDDVRRIDRNSKKRQASTLTITDAIRLRILLTIPAPPRPHTSIIPAGPSQSRCFLRQSETQ